ncbi:MAG: hypothetical protein ABI785_11150 [Gemmatimonadales bacterium]
MNKYLVREGQKIDLDAPWYIVPANQKWYRNHMVGSIVAETMDKLHLEYPKCDLSNVVVE